jgi:molybdopterin-guanine dinucleotide biosynthesis protein A
MESRLGVARPRVAVILAGGRARRLGGIDKAEQIVAGATLLQRVLSTVHDWGASSVVVVGPVRRGYPSVTWTREEPAGSGPAMGVAAAMRLIPDGTDVAVLAADLPWLTAKALDSLGSGAIAIDGAAREQWLVGVHAASDLRMAVRAGTSMRTLLDRPGLRRVSLDDGVLADCDTLAAVERAALGCAALEGPARVRTSWR